MCGIMAYVGSKEAFPILINGLKQLEYRGYDSSGVAVMNGTLSLLKKEGKVNDLLEFSKDKKTTGNIGLGHTRWATHGPANDLNAHPHQSESGRYTLVHNGIIENYQPLKDMLISNGYSFKSDTDTEVLVQLIDWHQSRYNLTTQDALGRAIQSVEGSFAIVLFDIHRPTELFVTRRQSPLVIGVGEQDFIISSDAMTIIDETNKVIYLEEDIITIMSSCGHITFTDLNLIPTEQEIKTIDNVYESSSKGDYDSYMLKEICEQDSSVARTINSYLNFNESEIVIPGLSSLMEDVDRIIIVACGTSWHSGLVAEYLIEKYAKINVEVEYASEFRYKDPLISNRDLVIGISQSGETADTIAALKIAMNKGARSMGIINGEKSTIARMVDIVMYVKAGPEISVASTKAFTSQLTAMLLFTLSLARLRSTISESEFKVMIEEVTKLPSHIRKVLQTTNTIKSIAHEFSDSNSAIFLARGVLYPLAIEGALKLKEISYIHAEGYPAGEMKHGPIALVDSSMPIITIANNDHTLQKLLSNVEEMKARGGRMFLVKSEDVEISESMAENVINTPICPSYINPIVQSIPLQLLSYHVAKLRGCNVDQPRNLAKSVTVE